MLLKYQITQLTEMHTACFQNTVTDYSLDEHGVSCYHNIQLNFNVIFIGEVQNVHWCRHFQISFVELVCNFVNNVTESKPYSFLILTG